MQITLVSLKQEAEQILSGEFPTLSMAHTKLHCTCGKGAQKQSPEACNCTDLMGLKPLLPFAAWHGHPWVTTEQSRILSLRLFQD